MGEAGKSIQEEGRGRRVGGKTVQGGDGRRGPPYESARIIALQRRAPTEERAESGSCAPFEQD